MIACRKAFLVWAKKEIRKINFENEMRKKIRKKILFAETNITGCDVECPHNSAAFMV